MVPITKKRNVATILEDLAERLRHMDERFDRMDARFDRLEAKIDAVDEKVSWLQNHALERVRREHKTAAELLGGDS